MASYVKATDFASKDGLLTGDPLKIVSGTEIDDEYNAIQTAINSKANTNSPAFTGSPTAPTATAGTNTTQLATTSFVQSALTPINTILAAVYPVGSIYTNATNSTNPGTLLGFGTWEAFGAGRVPVGFDAGNALFDTAEETGGSADSIVPSHTHTATVTDPGHKHPNEGANSTSASAFTAVRSSGNIIGESNTAVSVTGITVSNSTTGVSPTNTNYQPYITVYMWKRTA